jgi:hypothetical protein
MYKNVCLIIMILALFSFSACSKKETSTTEQNSPVANMPQGPIQTMPPGPIQSLPPDKTNNQGVMPPAVQMPPTAQQGMPMQKGKTQVIVPDIVRNKWSGAKIIVEDKLAKTKQEYTVKLNSDFKIPNTNLKIHVGEFLPDFRMEGFNLTSASNQPNNPALGVRIYENDKQVFPAAGKQWGWLFAKVPSIHAFSHPRYSIILKEGVSKS